MDDYLIYTCGAGERWDGIALLMYGRESGVRYLYEANPEYITKCVFDGGEKLKVPIIEQAEPEEQALPVWRTA